MSVEAVGTAGSYLGPMSGTSFSSELITSTIERLNTGYIGMTPVVNADYAAQSSILNGAYTAQIDHSIIDLTI